MEDKDCLGIGYVLEVCKKSAEDAAREALQQIEDRKYEEGMKNTGVKATVKIGLGFKGKELKLLCI